MKRKARKVWHVFAFMGVFALAIVVVMLLWNALIPSIIGWNSINYLQAGGIIILSRLLFGGLGHHGFGGHFRHHHKDHEKLHEKLKGMTFDERREFIRQRMTDFNEQKNDN